MKERILQFLKEENKTSAQFAEDIGVQPSGISHIMSGRNNPSLEFVLKMLEKYNYLSIDWLLFGKGEMYKMKQVPSLFDDYNTPIYTDKQTKQMYSNDVIKTKVEEITQTPDINEKNISKIVWFYDDNTFKEFRNEQ